MKKTYTIRVLESNMEKIKELAKKERRKIGDQMDIAIEFFLSNRE